MQDDPPAEPTEAAILPAPSSEVVAGTAAEAAAAPAEVPASGLPQLDPPENHRYVDRLRSIAGRKTAYQGPIIGITQGWVSRDAKWHAFAARYLDFVMLTDEHLVCFSTGFFSRRPRRRAVREPLNALVIVPRGPEPIRTLRIVGDFNRPLLFQLKTTPTASRSLASSSNTRARRCASRPSHDVCDRDRRGHVRRARRSRSTSSGKPRARSYREFPQHFPQPGWVEHDADDIWRVTVETLAEVAAELAAAGETIAAIGITNQRETVVVWDRRTGRPRHRAIVWQDRRTAARVRRARVPRGTSR